MRSMKKSVLHYTHEGKFSRQNYTNMGIEHSPLIFEGFLVITLTDFLFLF
jgi:hypothetical protein